MGNVSLKTKTFFLSGIIMGLFLVVGGVGIYAVEKLNLSLTLVSRQSLPAVRNMTLVDMMHDGIRAIVYKSLVAKADERTQVEAEFKEFSTDISSYLTAIESLKLDQELNEKIKRSRHTIAQYQKDAEKVISLALEGKSPEAMNHLPAFTQSFEALAQDLEAIGEDIEAKAKTQSETGEELARTLSKLTFGIVGLGLLVSMVVSFLAYRVMSGLTTDLLEITKGLKDESKILVETSDSMSRVSTELSNASTEQASNVQETVSSLDEISAMVSRNADSAGTSLHVSQESTELVREGKKKAHVMLSSIQALSKSNEEIVQELQKSNEEISDIVKLIQNISEKTRVINDIVFQTKLLSFNASVEAARAGEHGKGFAVVAEEVGNLATMSGKAATEISEILTGSVTKVTEIVLKTKILMDHLIQESKSKVEFNLKTSEECALAFDEILTKVTAVNQMINEIAVASKEQAAGVTEINRAMSCVDQVTQVNAGLAQESAKAAQTLEERVQKLDVLVANLTHVVGGRSETISASVQTLPTKTNHSQKKAA